MTQTVELLPVEGSPSTRTDAYKALANWVTEELEDALSARASLEAMWRECLRMYEAQPKMEIRNVPIENAPNYEVPVGAMAADAIYAQSVDLIWQVAPVVTCRPIGAKYAAAAKGLQKFINWGVANEWGLRGSVDNALLDNVQLGTAVLYIPWINRHRKTKTVELSHIGPSIFCVPIQDFLVPGGAASDLQDARWVAMRYWLTKDEMVLRQKTMGWDITAAQTAGADDTVRQKREQLGRQRKSGEETRDLYEIWDIYAYYDVDGDGRAEDLLITYDRSSKSILRCRWNPFQRRPFVAMRYQLRPHLFYGMGPLEMLKPLEEEISETHNHRMLNMMLANCRMWIGKQGEIDETMTIWPNKVLLSEDPKNSVAALQLGDVYPSSQIAEAILMAYAERRVGVSDISQARPSAPLGTRTPGITALSVLQQVNKRFTPAFDGMRLAVADAVRHALFRYQERLLAGDLAAQDKIRRIVGDQHAEAVLTTMTSPDFDEAVALELTASSASSNRDSDRQNALLLMNLMGSYYEKVMQLVAMTSNPQVPDQLREVARRIAIASSEALERLILTFDQIRDPETFLIAFDDLVQQQPTIGGVEANTAIGLQGMAQQIMGAMGGGEPQGGGGQGGPPA